MKEHPQDVKNYLSRLYKQERRLFECRAQTSHEFTEWQTGARWEFRRLLSLSPIAEGADGFSSEVKTLPGKEDIGPCFREQGWIETEPDVRVQFWMLTPKSPGPYPLAITPHGHQNGDSYAGVWHDEKSRIEIEQEDLDVAVQAAARGFLTIAPSTRGMKANPKSFRIADIADRHDGRDCRCHNWQIIMAGRTMMGERVWDLMRILDWALALSEVRQDVVLMMGNSGGGMASLHTTAVDERIHIAVPCCSYSNYVSPYGTLRHCTCNAIPGILGFGEFWDVAGLVAPRRMLTVNGDSDSLHPVDEVNYAVARLKKIYQAADAADNYEHRFGHGGHRFYSDLMWPWIDQAVQELSLR